jgi:DNA ligase D-like protein (predicted polymerase)
VRASEAVASLPFYRPQIATLVERPPTGAGWLHELKYAGYRMACFLDKREVRLESADGEDWTAQLAEIAEQVRRLPARSALLDGEVTLLLADGTSRVPSLQPVSTGAARQGLTYVVFDLLHLDGRNLATRPLEERKRACEHLFSQRQVDACIRYCAHLNADGPTVLARACALGAQGIVSKRRYQVYCPGRNEGWLATECRARADGPRAAPTTAHVSRTTGAAERAKANAHRKLVSDAARSARTTPQGAHVIRGVSITTPERPVYPMLAFTKLDLAELYAELANWMLPYIENRPLTLVRCERGVRKLDALRSECKFLRHEPGWHRWASPPIRRVHIQEQKKIGEYLVVDSPEGILALVQGDILEIHVWNARADRLEQPDRIVFDLDPGEAVDWARVVAAAFRLRAVLAAVGLQSWPKLTGGRGAHVVLPFAPEHDWHAVYELARKLAELAVQQDPSGLTLDYSKQARRGKILVDYKRNHRAAVAVAAYSTRARPAGSIGVPVSWRELKATHAPDRWSVANVRRRLKQLDTDPWKDFWSARQRLARST